MPHLAIRLFEEFANTRREMQEEARARRCRQDLFYRLSLFALALTPLCSRQDDVSLLAGLVIAQVSQKRGRSRRV